MKKKVREFGAAFRKRPKVVRNLHIEGAEYDLAILAIEHPALAVPVAEYDAFGWLVVKGKSMSRGTMSVAVNQPLAMMLGHDAFYL